MSTPNVTRADVIRMLQNNHRFKTVLNAIKSSTGYTPEKLAYLDDNSRSRDIKHMRYCTDFIVTLRLMADGSLIDDSFRDSAWLFPGFTSYDWNSTRIQNPLTVPRLWRDADYLQEDDNKAHLVRAARGSILHGVGGGSEFDKVVRDQKGVHFIDMSEDYDGDEDFEAHIYLTIEELNTL